MTLQQVGQPDTAQLSSVAGVTEVRRNYRNVCPAGNQPKCEEHEAAGVRTSDKTGKPDQGRAQTGEEKKRLLTYLQYGV